METSTHLFDRREAKEEGHTSRYKSAKNFLAASI